MIDDVRAAADVFRPVYDASGHGDGTVSIEVSPTLAFDTQGTIEAARRIWKTIDRPNIMVKIPGTDAGLPAIKQCLADGININITLLFAVERYKQVIEAFKSGLEQRVAAGLPVNTLHSVASRSLYSRVDLQTGTPNSPKPATRAPRSCTSSASRMHASRTRYSATR